MARVRCGVCGKLVDTTKNNYIYANGLHQHRKCPKSKTLTETEIANRLKLTDRIQELAIRHDRPLNWNLITKQIKDLQELGYSFKDQLYALNYIYDVDSTYWGYGRVKKFIAHAMEYKRKRMEYLKEKMNEGKIEIKSEFKVNSKPNFMDF